MSTLQLTTSEGKELRFELTEEVHKLGRLAENDLHVPDPTVSSNHAELHRQADGSYEIVDLESTNGTKVNGASIQRHKVVGGEDISFGQVTATFIGEGQAAGASGAQGAAAQGGGVEAMALSPEEAAAQGEITTSSERPEDFESSSPFGPKKAKKDKFGTIAMSVGYASIVTCLIAIALVFRMSA